MDIKYTLFGSGIQMIVLSVCLVLSGCSKTSKEPAPDPDNTINENEKDTSGDDSGYEIKVVSITGSGENAKAVIRVTRQ